MCNNPCRFCSGCLCDNMSALDHVFHNEETFSLIVLMLFIITLLAWHPLGWHSAMSDRGACFRNNPSPILWLR